MRALPSCLPKNPKALGIAESEPRCLLGGSSAGLLIKVITPIVGGGVEAFEPDAEDVRVASIRGAVRWWWRAMQTGMPSSELRVRERLIWGGVGKSLEECFASAVRVATKVTTPGSLRAAGEHVRREGRLGALPQWEGGADYGYALFPLQRSQEERSNFNTGNMPTRPWRTDVEFRLSVEFALRPVHQKELLKLLAKKESNEKLFLETIEDEVRLAFYLWLTFGGYGARTRRGFGALQAEGLSLPSVEKELLQWMAARPKGCLTSAVDRPTLAACEIRKGSPLSNAKEAHQALLKVYREFRQGTSFGRNRGATKAYGRSRWPEADSMRMVFGREQFRAHPVSPELKKPSAPRAELGLPIQMQFLGREDERANGNIVPLDNDRTRWASPVLFRPVVSGREKECVPVVLALAGHRPERVALELKNGKKESAESADVVYRDGEHGGAHEPVRSALRNAEGHAVEAFLSWVEQRLGSSR